MPSVSTRFRCDRSEKEYCFAHVFCARQLFSKADASEAGQAPWLPQIIFTLIVLVLSTGVLCERSAAQTQSAAHASAQAGPAQRTVPDRTAPSWLSPVDKLNSILPGWLLIGGEYRDRFENPVGVGFTSSHDSYVLDRLRVNATIQPRSWLLFYGEVQDARIFFNQRVATSVTYQDSWTLWQAYPQLGSSTSGWIDALAGRQVLKFGDERVIGPSLWNNVGRTFDVVRIDIHHPGFKVSLFSASVVPANNAYLHGTIAGNDLHGAYGSFDNVISHGLFEPYVLWHLAPGNFPLPETVGRGHLNEVTLGLHLKGTLPREFDYNTEWDGQTGSLGATSIAAWAGFAAFGKTFPTIALRPRIFAEVNFASGTKNLAGNHWNTFDQLYPSNHDKYSFADLAGRRNLEQSRAGIEETITKKWSIRQALEGLWLFTSGDNFYNSSGAIAVAAHPGASRHIGNEIDLTSVYEIEKGLDCGFGYARLFAGAFLRTASQGRDYSYPYAFVEYKFSKIASQ